MVLRRTHEEILRLIDDDVIGRMIATFEVFGVNSLKTVSPPPGALAGDVIDAAAFDGDGRLQLTLQRARVEIDLARTGGLEFGVGDADGARPTGRVSFVDGSRLDFKEPAKTKRITFSVWHS